MNHITLTEEQAQVIVQAHEPVELRDPSGSVLTRVSPLVTTEEIAEIKRRSAQYKRRFTSEQVAAHFRVLQEAVERDQLTPDQVVQLLRRLQDETPA
jgi:hypothetical protein